MTVEKAPPIRDLNVTEASISFLSELCHYWAFILERPTSRLEIGTMVISIDVDVGSKKVGEVNKGRNDVNVSRHLSEYLVGKIEEQAIPLFIELFENYEMPATFAIRGQLAEANDSVLKSLLDSPVRHDIGAHGYYHRMFETLSPRDAETELRMISASMEKLKIAPRSFVFPKNSIAHLNLLEEYGYKCYRGSGSLLKDRMRIRRHGSLVNVWPSLYISQDSNPYLLKRILDISINKKLPVHFWFHLWNFGQNREQIRRNMRKVLEPTFDYAKRKEKNRLLTFDTMLSAAEKTRTISNDQNASVDTR